MLVFGEQVCGGPFGPMAVLIGGALYDRCTSRHLAMWHDSEEPAGDVCEFEMLSLTPEGNWYVERSGNDDDSLPEIVPLLPDQVGTWLSERM